MTTQEILVEAHIAADYLEERMGFTAAVKILRDAAAVTLLEFCEADFRQRWNFSEPFVWKGYLYATDFRVLLRLPTTQKDTVDSAPPSLDGGFDRWFVKPPDVQWQPWPIKPLFVKIELSSGGIPCPICHTNGEYYCDGEAYQCVYCDGTGYVELIDDVELGKARVSGRYWRLISKLPDVWWHECAEPIPRIDDRQVNPIHFRFRGGEGLLMPRTR